MDKRHLLPPANGDFLSQAEKRLVRAAASGERWKPSATDIDPDNVLRASVIRSLLTGTPWRVNENPWPVHSRGLAIFRAHVEGDIDLVGCDALFRFIFRSSVLDGKLLLTDASTLGIYLDGSTVGLISGHRVRIDGPFHLRRKFRSKQGVDLTGANITGNLSFRGAILGQRCRRCSGLPEDCCWRRGLSGRRI